MRRYRWHVALGVLFLCIAPASLVAAAWLSPVTLGLLASPWLAMWTARPSTGARAQAKGYFCVPRAPDEPYLREAVA